MIDRRRFLQCVSAAAITPALTISHRSALAADCALLPDPKQILDLPAGFSYTTISSVGQTMSDGIVTPGAHDGMAAFAGDGGRIILVCNHELSAGSVHAGPYEGSFSDLQESMKARFYDRGNDQSPGLGGTTTTIYNPSTQAVEKQFLSLGGTDINCAGGRTPWGSWLSCEESFAAPEQSLSNKGQPVVREKRHGYVFEVPSSATELVKAVAITDMGRFEHEAAAVHEPTGIVYQTEDQWHSLFYRFLPNEPGQLHKGGRLQALALIGEELSKTHNWDRVDVIQGKSYATRWIDLENVDSEKNDLRMRGAALGAATFARGEGLTSAGDGFAFTCTIGGPARLGQIFDYEPSPFEGEDREVEAPGQLTLIAEADSGSLLKNGDNLTMAPWGDLLVCEDTTDNSDHCALVGVRPDGSQYLVANNAYSNSELAGVCFSPDGETMFVNIQYPGRTVAITGDWPV